MPTFLNWLLRLLPTNPICMRLVQGGSRRLRHLYIRSGYLAAMIVVLLFVLLSSGVGTLSLRQLAGAGANMFQYVSFLQVGLICALTPVFMAGAIAQEANPKTWDILLTTPLNNLQIVLGNLFGRLFFVIALLFSSLPLFVMTQYFGGVPGESIFLSYAIAGASALLVAAIAITLCVTRTAGRRAVFIFYASVVIYLFVTWALDRQLRSMPAAAGRTTIMTPLNPFLALRVLLDVNRYMPHDFTGESVMWLKRIWLGHPIGTFCWLSVILSFVMMLFSTLRVRLIGASVGKIPWYRRLLGLGAKDARARGARHVGRNPISWRERVLRGRTPVAILARWGFVAIGLVIAIVLVTLYHTGIFNTPAMRNAVAAVLAGEIVIIALAALQMSATAVSREREDGTLDIILTTPIQPGPYIWGKMLGLMQYLIPMILVPSLTLLIIALYVLADGLGREGGVLVNDMNPQGTNTFNGIPVVLPEGAIAIPLLLAPFIAFCVMVGLHWSIRSRGTIGSMVAAFGIVASVVGVLSLCGMGGGKSLSFPGAVLNTFSPITLAFTLVEPAKMIPDAMDDGIRAARTSIVIGAAIGAAGFAFISYGLHANMKRTFMMTTRRLAGQR
jgi:ABC-type transport system involved in multi-copper enzyme maturation permease subunit